MGNEAPVFSMSVFLPDARDGLGGLVHQITSDKGFLFDHLPKWRVPVGEFRLPKFKLSSSGDISKVLIELGLRLPFDRSEADLSGMVEGNNTDDPVFVTGVLHEAVMEVKEEGSRAAAVTVMHMISVGCQASLREPRKRVDFVADHPFAFFIVEETSGSILFAGLVNDPSQNK